MRRNIKTDKRALMYSRLVEGRDVVIDASAVVDSSVELSIVVDGTVLVENGADVVVWAVLDVCMLVVDSSDAAVIKIGAGLKSYTKCQDSILTL